MNNRNSQLQAAACNARLEWVPQLTCADLQEEKVRGPLLRLEYQIRGNCAGIAAVVGAAGLLAPRG